MNPKEIVNQLSKLLECEIIIIPALRSKNEDFSGHADGMVRFVDLFGDVEDIMRRKMVFLLNIILKLKKEKKSKD